LRGAVHTRHLASGRNQYFVDGRRVARFKRADLRRGNDLGGARYQGEAVPLDHDAPQLAQAPTGGAGISARA